eukprot:TRINITY_DN2488_c3_g1_i1.p1 TRINITY_DN2488_c3_g1~~TRINITY_DN2488_c3_g1_i1.p1  ORF type:complete len:209 (-),score=31.52 TRINITY_DN2488_c3_g1_i1:48-632(-)
MASLVSRRVRNFASLPFKHIEQGLTLIPEVSPKAFVAPSADLIGQVSVAEGANIWYQCVLRGDAAPIEIGSGTNIQDGTIIHVASSTLGKKERPTIIGKNCTVGHQALLHACTLQDRAFVGMQACVMDGAVVESDSMIAAGALVTPGKVIRSGELWSGRPAKKMRLLTDDEVAFILKSAEHYRQLGLQHKESIE